MRLRLIQMMSPVQSVLVILLYPSWIVEEGSSRPPRAPDSNAYRQQHNLVVWDSQNPHTRDANETVPPPMERFEDFRGISQATLNSFYRQGFKAPTPIQVKAQFEYTSKFLHVIRSLPPLIFSSVIFSECRLASPSVPCCDSLLSRICFALFSRGHATLHIAVSVGRSHLWIPSGFCITAPAQPSATGLPCIRPCCPNWVSQLLLFLPSIVFLRLSPGQSQWVIAIWYR